MVLFIASLFNLIYSGFILRIKFKVKFRLLYSSELAKQILIIVLPFALAAIFAKIYAYIDIFFLKIFLGDEEVGFYSVAYKITFALQFIPLAFVAALYPAFAEYYKDNSDKLQRTFIRAFHYLAFIAIPISLGIIALADEIISKVYTAEFSFSTLPLQVLIASIPFLFINFALSFFLNATDRQRINTRNLGLTMVLNIVLNIILIQKLGIWGAALASSVSTLFLFSLNLKAVLKVIKTRIKMFKPLINTIFAGIIMFAIVIFLKTVMPWYFTVVVGGIIYLGLMLVSGTLRKEDLIYITKSLSKTE